MPSSLNRRFFLRTASVSLGGLWLPSLWQSGAFAEELIRTPAMTEGPFYPDKLPLDTDNDLLVLNDSLTPAVGEVVHLTGKVMTSSGSPIRNAFVEIWQVDNNGVYLHSGSDNGTNRDANFQGYGRFLTDSTGRYYFRTVKPVPYPGRTPHIHVAVSRNGKRELTTQMLINGHPQNSKDGLFRAIRDPFQRESILVDFEPIADSRIGELSANFDLVLGVTPDESIEQIKGGIAPRQQR
ncbi:Protocatechuate 3,4-dioxygenase beta chain [Thalassoglobus neptunius]|uniref:Protocatechuate 3,4-dioxygenase beta chain n=1 Tax=Thalassoglobus neptunius TaxID=1938619 RepID=A0A5C5X570_9PLAN|nr:protocatechuate 3,4-dioxygenase [Thalassoglobus neptunius]TWT57759.1 Protocatechuate 3,4-dioxygenase beta chain [Thalassoglobus neptunius]